MKLIRRGLEYGKDRSKVGGESKVRRRVRRR